MKVFKIDGVTYRNVQTLADGIQYEADYHDCTTARVYIHGKRHTRAQVINSFKELECQHAAEIENEQ